MNRDGLRVLCLSNWYPPHHFGGYELSAHDVMVRLAERGHHVEVLTSEHRHRGTEDGDASPIARVHRRLKLYFRDGELWSPSPVRRLQVERHNHRALSDAIESCQPDVVSVWHVGAMSLGLLSELRRRNIPLVFAICDDWTIYAHRIDPWTRMTSRSPRMARILAALTGVPAGMPDLNDAGAACFVSAITRSRSEEKSQWRFPRHGLVYSGIDRRLFHPQARRETSKPGRSRVRLLYVGRIDPRKGIQTLLRAIALLPRTELEIIGQASTSERATLDKWIADAGVTDRVSMRSVLREQLPALYGAADICVFPSEWAEPFGLVPLEAMAVETPVVASGVGGSGDFLADGQNCVIFEPGNEHSLAAAVQRLIDDPDLRQRLERRGLQTAEYFDVDHLADVFDAWHHAVLDRSAPTPGDRPLPRLG